MNKIVGRRGLICGSAIAMLAGLAGCVTTKVENTTTVTIDTAKVKSYAQAGIVAAGTAGAVLKLYPTLSMFALPLTNSVSVLQNALSSFDKLVGDKVSVSYDNSSIKTIVHSILDVITQISNQIGDVITALKSSGLNISDDTINKVEIAKQALSMIVSIMSVMLASSEAHKPTIAVAEQSAFTLLEMAKA